MAARPDADTAQPKLLAAIHALLSRSFSLAVFSPQRLFLAFLAVAGCYTLGRVMDGIWTLAGAGSPAAVSDDRVRAAPIAFTIYGGDEYREWEERLAAERAIAREAAKKPDATPEQRQLAKRLALRGPFATWLDFETGCLSASLHGLGSGRIAYAEPGDSDDFSLLTGVSLAGVGMLWLVTQHPIYTLLFGLLCTWILYFFGAAIARSAAVEGAGGEPMTLLESLQFARARLGTLLSLPAVLLAVALVLAALLVLGGLVGAIPWIGELLAGVFLFLSLLTGGILAFLLLAWIVCGHLFVPNVAVEGSGAMEAIGRSSGYIGGAPWRFSLYVLLLLVYGGLCFILLRFFVAVALKLTHSLIDAGMSVFGLVESAGDPRLSKLNAMWRMPDWNEISLLPGASALPFYGTFHNAQLNWSETAAMWLIECWVYGVVGFIGAALVSFYFVGCTRLMLVLRRDVDGESIDHIYSPTAEPVPAPEVEPAPVAT